VTFSYVTPVTKLSRLLLSNRSRCSLLKTARPRLLDEVRADPVFQLSISGDKTSGSRRWPHAHLSPAAMLVMKPFSFSEEVEFSRKSDHFFRDLRVKVFLAM
jgi:hypothetical protein